MRRDVAQPAAALPGNGSIKTRNAPSTKAAKACAEVLVAVPPPQDVPSKLISSYS